MRRERWLRWRRAPNAACPKTLALASPRWLGKYGSRRAHAVDRVGRHGGPGLAEGGTGPRRAAAIAAALQARTPHLVRLGVVLDFTGAVTQPMAIAHVRVATELVDVAVHVVEAECIREIGADGRGVQGAVVETEFHALGE